MDLRENNSVFTPTVNTLQTSTNFHRPVPTIVKQEALCNPLPVRTNSDAVSNFINGLKSSNLNESNSEELAVPLSQATSSSQIQYCDDVSHVQTSYADYPQGPGSDISSSSSDGNLPRNANGGHHRMHTENDSLKRKRGRGRKTGFGFPYTVNRTTATANGSLPSPTRKAVPPNKLFQCALCDFRTPYYSSLDVHTKSIHSMERPFSCVLCEYTCKLKGNLKKHYMGIHKMEAEPAASLLKQCSNEKTNTGAAQMSVNSVQHSAEDVATGEKQEQENEEPLQLTQTAQSTSAAGSSSSLSHSQSTSVANNDTSSGTPLPTEPPSAAVTLTELCAPDLSNMAMSSATAAAAASPSFLNRPNPAPLPSEPNPFMTLQIDDSVGLHSPNFFEHMEDECLLIS